MISEYRTEREGVSPPRRPPNRRSSIRRRCGEDRYRAAGVTALYLLGLFTTVAGLVCYPQSEPLLWLLMAWVGCFFIVASVIILATFGFLASCLYRLVIRGDEGVKLADRRETSERATGVWDRWLDGGEG